MKSYREVSGDGGSGIAAQVAEQRRRLARRLERVDRTVAVTSGKGGVGKSSVAAWLASALAERGERVGLVDADVNGPSAAGMLGLSGAAPAEAPPSPSDSASDRRDPASRGLVPPRSAEGVRVMGMDLFLPDAETPVRWDAPTEKDAFTWRESMETAAVREFVADTEWGDLDWLLFDLPPGSRRLPHLADLLPDLTGAVVVTLPSGVARSVVGRSVRLAKELLEAPLLGLVENMSAHRCPHCGESETLFPPGEVPLEEWAAERGLTVLGRIPFDPRLARAADRGVSFLGAHPHSGSARRIRTTAEAMARAAGAPRRGAEEAEEASVARPFD